MRRAASVVMVTLLLAGTLALAFNIQTAKAGRTINIKAGETLSPDFIEVVILDINVSLYETYPGAIIHVYVTVEATWDVFDFSSFWVEALYNGSSIDRENFIVLWSGHDIFTIDFTWDTSGVEIGSYLILAMTSTMFGYVDGYVQILPVGNLNTQRGYLTIQEAINNASEGDSIFVSSGTYYENVVVNKSVSLFAENKDTVIVGGNVTGGVISIQADNVLIEGFEIAATTLVGSRIGIVLNSSSNCEIKCNTIDSGLGYGIIVDNGGNNSIIDNDMVGCSGLGILVDNSSHNLIMHNSMDSHAHSISLIDSNFNHLLQNFFGVHFTGYICVDLRRSNNNIIEGCDLYSIFPDKTYMKLASSNNNSIFHNNFFGSDCGVYLYDTNVGNRWDNGCEGNYWSNYNGSDLDGDGVGDTYLPWEGVDNCPLMNLYWNPSDVNHDLKVDIYDVVLACSAYTSTPSDPHWNPHCDIAKPHGIIDIYDVVMICSSYGEEYLP